MSGRARRTGRRLFGLARLLTATLVIAAITIAPVVGLSMVWRWSERLAAEPNAPTVDLSRQMQRTPVTRDHAGSDVGRAPQSTRVVAWRRVGPAVGEQHRHDLLMETIDALRDRSSDSLCALMTVDGTVVVGHRPDTGLALGDAQMLVTAAVALHELGPDHRFTTQIRAAAIRDGVVDGDLYVIGGGDPMLVSPDLEIAAQLGGVDVPPVLGGANALRTDVADLIDQVIASGLTAVLGDVIGDGRRYDDEYLILSEPPTDRIGPHAALLVNRGLLFGSSYGLNPVQSGANEVLRQLRRNDVSVAGRSRTRTDQDRPQVLQLLARVESAPLVELIEVMLAERDRVGFEMLLKEIGVASGRGGSRAGGLGQVADTLFAWGVNQDESVMLDGSGAAAGTRVSCAGLLAALSHIGSSTDRSPAFVEFSSAGVQVTAVTGLDAGARSLSGVFVGGPDGSALEELLAPLNIDSPAYEPARDDVG